MATNDLTRVKVCLVILFNDCHLKKCNYLFNFRELLS